jgi:hypothetical protein
MDVTISQGGEGYKGIIQALKIVIDCISSWKSQVDIIVYDSFS